MLKGIAQNPYINHTTPLDVIETELRECLDYAEKVMDWDLSNSEIRYLEMLTKLAKAKGTKIKW